MDFRHGLRSLRANPGYAMLAITVLALGIGATTTIFSVVYGLLWKPLPFRDSARLVHLWARIPDQDHTNLSPNEIRQLLDHPGAFSQITYWTGNLTTYSHNGQTASARSVLVAPNFFDTLAAPNLAGRSFTSVDVAPGLTRPVVISERLWRTRFASDPGIAGRALICDAQPCVVTGVMPSGFAYPDTNRDLWIPQRLDEGLSVKFPSAHFFRVVARISDRATPGEVSGQLDGLAARFKTLDPESITLAVSAEPMRERVSGSARQPLLIASAAVGALLLITCLNIANLMLARSVSRRRELAVRAALGATRGRLVRLLLSEAGIVAALGGALGVLLSAWSIELLSSFGSAYLPRLNLVRLEWPALLFAAATSVLSAIAFGTLPALDASRGDVQRALRDGGRSVTGSAGARQWALMLGEVALSFVLVALAGLMLRSLWNLSHQSTGFSANALAISTLTPDSAKQSTNPDPQRFIREMTDRLRALPEIEAAGASSHIPFGGDQWGEVVEIEGVTPASGQPNLARAQMVSPGYFNAIGIPLLTGRDFAPADQPGRPLALIVNQAFVDRYLQGRNPLQTRARTGREWAQIVAVAGNVRFSELSEPLEPEVYMPVAQAPAGMFALVGRSFNFVVRTATPAATLSSAARAIAREIDPSIAIGSVEPVELKIQESLSEPRFRTWLIALFAAAALGLASAGIYGVLSFMVEQRSQEIGIRVALGASAAEVIRLVLGRVAGITAAGIAIGLVAALAGGSVLASLLFGISPRDWVTLSAVAGVLFLVALAAGIAPVRRALAVDPVVTLR